MINKYTNKQRGLLAVIMAMVMVFAGAAFVAAEVDADPATIVVDVTTGDDDVAAAEATKPFKTLSAAIGAASAGDIIKLNTNVEMVTSLTIDKNVTIDLNDKKLSVVVSTVQNEDAAIYAAGCDVTIKNGSLYVSMAERTDGQIHAAIWAKNLTLSDVDADLYCGADVDGVTAETDNGKKTGHVTEIANTLTINQSSVVDAYGANRALYAHDISIDNSIVNAGAYEKAIRATPDNNEGAVDITGNSVVTAKLIPGGSVNDSTENDRMGVKAYNVNVGEGSELIADGVHVTATGSTIGGKLTVTYNEQSGKYTITPPRLSIAFSSTRTLSASNSIP